MLYIEQNKEKVYLDPVLVAKYKLKKGDKTPFTGLRIHEEVELKKGATPAPKKEETYEEKIKRLGKEAEEYYATVKVVPTPEEIVGYVAEAVEDESGYMDEEGEKKIAKILSIKVEA